MSVACTNCGAAVQLASSLNHTQLHTVPNDPLIPFVKAQIDDLTAQNSNLVAENDSLSSKLVESTEGRIDLDQQLTMTQMELQTAQTELRTLQTSQKHYDELLSMIATGQLIEKKDVQPVIENLAYESQRRSQIENSKLQLESELEDLSRSLFEEANRMVNEERQATFLAGKKAEGLERQLDEVLDLCKSEREQLVELKLSMQKLSEEKDQVQRERDAIEFAFVQLQQQQHHQQQLQLHHSQLLGASTSSSPTSIHHHMSATTAARRGIPLLPPTSPSSATGNINGMTPLGINVDAATTSSVRKHVQQVLQYDARQHRSSASSIKSKTDSCYFSDGDHPGSHLLNEPNEERIPTLGFHLWDPSFVEFKTYMESLFGSGTSKQDATDLQKGGSASPSATSSGISSMYSFSLMTKTTPPPAPAANAVIPINNLLANCKLLKKMSSEDVEATLRFDPGNLLSWTQRKRLMTAVTDNTLVVESIPSTSVRDSQQQQQHQQQSLSPTSVTPTTASPATRPNCALCGHGITTPLYYQYRLTDTANESRTICPYCRTRLTSVCTFYSVLRMLSKRIISSTTTPEKLYLDFLRIRLGMFMARCGVGIVTGDEVKPQSSPLPPHSHASPSQPQQQQVPTLLPKRDSGATTKSALPPRPPLAPVTITTNTSNHNNHSSSSLNSSATAPDPPMPTNTKILPALPSPVPPSPTPSSALPPLPAVVASTVITSNVVPNQATLATPL